MTKCDVDPTKSKTKCIIFSRKPVDSRKVSPIVLNHDPLPWVPRVDHLGNVLQCDNKMSIDLAKKRGKLIGKLNSLSQEFHYVEPLVFVKILNIYASSFYGSSLWDIFSSDCERIYASWNVAVRICFNVDRTTHRYFIEELSESLHPKVMLCSRFISFQKSLLTCNKFPVRFLASLQQNDQRTVFGRTLKKISNQCGTVDQLPSNSQVKMNMKYFAVPATEAWRPSLLKNLLDIRNDRAALPGFSNTEVEEMIKFVATS